MIEFLRRIVHRYRRDGVRGLCNAVERRLLGDPRQRAFRRLEKRTAINVVQIGAFEGKSSNDPIFDLIQNHCRRAAEGVNSTIVLVEPVKENFDRLRSNYGDLPGLFFENIAIAENAGVRDFFRLGVDPIAYGYPAILAQMGSLRADRIGSLWEQLGSNLEYKKFYQEHVQVDKVQCMTIEGLLAKYSIKNLDLLQIDTEGYDYEILKTIEFSRVRPRLIHYERALLFESEPACRKMLTTAGYRLIDYGPDTLCVRK